MPTTHHTYPATSRRTEAPMAATTTTTEFGCKWCNRGTRGTVSSSYAKGTARVSPCPECQAQGIRPFRVPVTRITDYLDAPAAPAYYRHPAGLVVFA